MMTKLPFLKATKWPRLAPPASEVRYGYSEDDETSEMALKELMHAYEAKDGRKMLESLRALIEIIRNKSNALDSQ